MISQFVFGILIMILVENLLSITKIDTKLYTIIIVAVILIFDIFIKSIYGGM